MKRHVSASKLPDPLLRSSEPAGDVLDPFAASPPRDRGRDQDRGHAAKSKAMA